MIKPVVNGLPLLGKKVDYGLYLMTELAKIQQIKSASKSQKCQSVMVLANCGQMSFSFLQKVALYLRRGGLIQAGRGKMGGYKLSKPASKITIKEIIEVIEGPLTIMRCIGVDGKKHCINSSNCSVRPGLAIINNVITKALEDTSLSDILKIQ